MLPAVFRARFPEKVFIFRAAPPQEAAPCRDAGTAAGTAAPGSLRSALPGKTNPCVFALTIHSNVATDNFKLLNWDRFPKGFQCLPLPQSGI